jgi:hypothetical protein
MIRGRKSRPYRRTALTTIKLVHTLAWFSIEASMVYVLWAGFTRRSDRRAAVAAGVVAGETAIFAANRFRCPLTDIAERLGAERGTVTDIYLPAGSRATCPQSTCRWSFSPPSSMRGISDIRDKAAIAALAAVAGLAYQRFGRPKMLRGGISETDARVPLPRDGPVPDPLPGNNSTHAITIDAPPQAVWPWIGQIGHNRAGWYSHEWVERLFGIRYADGRSATRIHPEFQNLRVGDRIPYSPFNAIPVVAIEPEQYLIIGNSVAWVLQDLGGSRTRLIVRTRGHGWFRSLSRKIPILRQVGAVIDYVIGEPLHHYMEKGMCIGIAARVEGRLHAPTETRPADSAAEQ